MELLRIVAMFFVLIVHADFFSLGAPSAGEMRTAPWTSAAALFIEYAAIVCVNLFVLISGYFSIVWKIRSFAGFVFQCLFFFLGIWVLMTFSGLAPFSARDLAACFGLMENNWFVKAYVGLYLLAPVLNAFVERSTKRELALFILLFYLFQFSYGLLFVKAMSDFQHGYSVLSFVGLYFIGRYIRLHGGRWCGLKRGFYPAVYLGTVVLATVTVMALGLLLPGNRFLMSAAMSVFAAYNGPTAMLCSVALFLYFTRLKFHSRAINRIAGSAFAVYLLHTSSLIIPRYKQAVLFLRDEISPPLLFGAAVLAFAVAVFAVAVVADRLRIFCWNRFWPRLEEGMASFRLRTGNRRP